MPHRLRQWVLLGAALTGAAACASSAPAPDAYRPPELVSRQIPPSLKVPMTSSSGRAPVRVTIEVVIDSIGQPDMTTFKVTGFGAAENEEALRQWIQQAAFTPAHRAGEAVAGLFQMKLQAQIRRIG